jgi:hypothetical protein
VRAPGGKDWLKTESLAAYRAGKDPSKQGVADRHAAARAAADVLGQQPPPPPDPEPAQDDLSPRSSEYNYQESKAKSEHFAAEREQVAYLKEAGELVELTKVVASWAAVGTTFRNKLESWITTLPPQFVGRNEAFMASMLSDQVETILSDLVETFNRLASSNAD